MMGSRPRGPAFIRDWFTFTTYLAMTLVGLGFLFIFLAWNGAAEVDTIQQQFPYIISGGLTGLASIVLGVAVLIVQDARRRAVEQGTRLDQLQEALSHLAEGMVAALPTTATEGLVVAGASSYHDPTCHLVEGRDEADRITPEEAEERGLAPCRICKP